MGLGNWISSPYSSSSKATIIYQNNNHNTNNNNNNNYNNINHIFDVNDFNQDDNDNNDGMYDTSLLSSSSSDTALTDGMLTLLADTSISRCTEVRTLDATPSLITDENGLSSHGIIHSLLTRRLGLIVGCCLGIIVFIVLISVLGYLKLKKQRIENAKRQQPIPPEYLSYRHFSIPHDETNRTLTTTSGLTVDSNCSSNHPTFISGAVLGTTTISC